MGGARRCAAGPLLPCIAFFVILFLKALIADTSRMFVRMCLSLCLEDV